jgi:uncharacterized membrane protein YgcG
VRAKARLRGPGVRSAHSHIARSAAHSHMLLLLVSCGPAAGPGKVSLHRKYTVVIPCLRHTSWPHRDWPMTAARLLELGRKAAWHVSRQAARRVAGERAGCAGAGAGMPHKAQHAQTGTTSQRREETTLIAPGRRLLSSTPKLPGEPAASGGSAGGGGGGDGGGGGGGGGGQEGPSETQKTIQVPADMLAGVKRCWMP